MTATGADVRERVLRVRGRDVRVLEAGAGPPVVLVHGLGLTAGVWRPHLEALARAGYRCAAPDLPGFGHSEGRWSGLTVAGAADWLDAFAGQAGLHRAAWVGHSVAAQQVTRLAAARPGRVAALLLAAPTGRGGRHGVAQFTGLVRTAFREDPDILASVIRRYFTGPLPTLGTWLRSLGHDLALDAPQVACPVLLVDGENDPIVRRTFVDRLLRVFPDATATRIEGAAHAVALDPLEPFLQALLTFLARRYSPGELSPRSTAR